MINRLKPRIDNTGEIFTPPALVNEMLDALPEEFFQDPSKTVLEPSMGDGNFLVELLARFSRGLAEVIPDPAQRHAHIVENILYGVDFMPDNVEAAIDRLNARGLNHNLVWANSLNWDFSFGNPTIDESGFETPPMDPKDSFSKEDIEFIESHMGNDKPMDKPKSKIIETMFDDFFE